MSKNLVFEFHTDIVTKYVIIRLTVTKIVTKIIKSGYLSPKTGAYMKRITGNTVKLKEEKIMVCPKCGKEFDGILCASCGYAAEE